MAWTLFSLAVIGLLRFVMLLKSMLLFNGLWFRRLVRLCRLRWLLLVLRVLLALLLLLRVPPAVHLECTRGGCLGG